MTKQAIYSPKVSCFPQEKTGIIKLPILEGSNNTNDQMYGIF